MQAAPEVKAEEVTKAEEATEAKATDASESQEVKAADASEEAKATEAGHGFSAACLSRIRVAGSCEGASQRPWQGSGQRTTQGQRKEPCS